MNILRAVIILSGIEKMLQHALTAVFFLFTIPGIGTPDTGPYFVIDNTTMAILNIAMFLVFAIGLYGFYRESGWGLPLVAVPAAADIVFEFVFHGLFFITVSVIVSTFLVVACLLYRKEEWERQESVDAA